MFRAHPNVIGALLRQWEGPEGMKRWYYNKWDRYLSTEQIMDYRARFGVDPADWESGIHIYFDESGYLHIANCRDPELESFLQSKMYGWYQWARKTYREKFGYPSMNVLELIEPYTRTIKPGFYQTRYNGEVFNFDEETWFMLSERYLPFDHERPGYWVNTGHPRLDGILRKIINSDDSTFPAYGFSVLFG